MERKGVVTVKGGPVTLVGPELKTGDRAPDFKVLDSALKEVSLGDLGAGPKLISVTPSLDTPVCDRQARRFNEEASRLPEEATVVNISVDLPFAISRFCITAGIERIKTLSDHRDLSFGTSYGVLIKELRLLARSIFVLDRSNTIRYMEIVPELTNDPDYKSAIEAVKNISSGG